MSVSDRVGGNEWAVTQIFGKAEQVAVVEIALHHVQTISQVAKNSSSK
jgi:predicted Fe-Mo cluster-binding NifX family protein